MDSDGGSEKKPVLPRGWVIRKSKKHPDKVYYFHLATGVSTWEPPHVIAQADSTVNITAYSKGMKVQKGKGTTSEVAGSFPSVFSYAGVSSSGAVDQVKRKEMNKKMSKEIERLEKRRTRIIMKLLDTHPREPNKQLPSESMTASSSNKPKKKYNLKRNTIVVGTKLVTHRKSCRNYKKSIPVPKSEEMVQCTDVEMTDVSDAAVLKKHLFGSPLRDDDEKQPYYVVVDTNILIHDLKFVDELKDQPLQGHGPPTIFIPWVVIQELDSIKFNTKTTSVKPELHRLACDAVIFLNKMLTAKHPRIRGQDCQMANQVVSSMVPKCNDDRVLVCCLQLIELMKIPRDRVVLLSNDKNLCNKALITEIKAHTTGSILNDFQVDFSPVKKDTPPAYLAFANFPTAVQMKMVAEVKAEVDTLVCRMKLLCKEAFGKILETEMKAIYGELWEKILYVQKPWSFIDILECFKHHWFAVFGFIFSRNLRDQVDVLRTAMRETKGYICDEHQAFQILEAALALCNDVENKYEDLRETSKELRSLYEQCQSLCNKTSLNFNTKVEKSIEPKVQTSSEERQKQILIVFQQTWSSLNKICGTALDSLGHVNHYHYDMPATLPSEKETIEFLEKMYGPLRTLSQCMNCMRNILRTSKDEGNFRKACADLYENLTNFLPSLDLHLLVQVEFSVKDMEEFCRNPAKRELLDNGHLQLSDFFKTVHTCLHSS